MEKISCPANEATGGSAFSFEVPMIFDDDTARIMKESARVALALDLPIDLHLANEQNDRVAFCISLHAKVLAPILHIDH